MTSTQRFLAALFGAGFASIVSAAWILFGVSSPIILIAIPTTGAVVGALSGDRGLKLLMRLVGALA